MKKYIFSLALFAIMATTSFAQTEVGHFYIQPQIGVNWSKWSGGGLTTDFKSGILGGIEAGYQFSDQFGGSIGVMYSVQGAKGASDSDYPGKVLKYSYLNVPILFNYSPLKRLTLKAGIQPGFILSQDKFGDINTVDITLPIGASYEISNIVLDARYNIGLSNIDESKMKNNVIQITIGYKFNL